ESPFTLDSTPTYVDESPNVFNPPPQPPIYPCEFCGNDAYYGHYCTPQAPFTYPEPCYNQEFNFQQDFQTVPQQYPCCDDCGVTHDAYQCQPINEVYYNEQASCFDSNSFGFDQSQPQQCTVDHPIFNAHNSYPDSQIQLNSTLAKIKDQMTSITSLCEMACQFVQQKLEEKQLEEERAAKANNWKLFVCYDDDDDEERSDSLDDNIFFGLPPFFAIIPDEPVLSTEEPDNSLSIGDEHLNTIPATESDEFKKSGVENLIPIPSESEGIPEHVCDVPSHDNSPPLDVSKDTIEDLSESNEEFSSNDDDSFSFDKIDYVEASPPDSELVSSKTKSSSTSLNSLLEETHTFHNSLPEFTTFSKVLFDAECKSDSSDDQSCSDEDVLEKIILKPLSEEEIIPMKSLRTHDSSLPISSKIDSLLDEFVGELTLLKSIPPGIDETDCDFEEDIRLIDKLLYDNSSPRPPEEFVSANSDDKVKSFSPSPILVKDSDSLMEEMIYSVLRITQCHRALWTRIMTLKGIFSFLRTCLEIIPFHLLKKSHSILIFFHFLVLLQNHQMEKSPDLLSHRCRSVKKFNTHRSHLNTCPMLIHGQNNPLLDVLLESEGIPEHMCDVLSHDNSLPLGVSKNQFEDLSKSNEEFSSTDDDSFSFDNIDYVEASPPDFELISSEVMEIVIPEVGGIEASNDNPIPFYDPIIPGTPPNSTPSRESDFFLEVDAFLAVEDESTSSQFPKSYLDPEGDMLLFEAFLNDDHSSDFKTKSSSTSLNSLLEETNNFDNSLPKFTTFSNDPFDAKYESDSSDDQSSSDEDILKKIISKPLSQEEIIPMESLRTHDSSLPISSKIDSLLDEFAEIIPMEIDPHSFNAESDLIESMPNNDSSIIISSKIDSLFDEFAGELTLLKSIPPGIDETDCHPEEETHFTKRLLYDNSSPRPPEEFVSDNSNADIESFSLSHILIKDSDSYMEEIDLFCTLDYPMPPGIEDKDVVEDISPTKEPQVLNTLPTHPTLQLNMKFQPSSESLFTYVVWIFLPFLVYSVVPHYLLSLRTEDIIFDPGICNLTFSKPDISHRCGTIKKFNTHRSHLNKCPMMIHGQNNPPLDVLLFHFYPP
nr:hypothetical protein [Tanacetum cinerariifolium]